MACLASVQLVWAAVCACRFQHLRTVVLCNSISFFGNNLKPAKSQLSNQSIEFSFIFTLLFSFSISSLSIYYLFFTTPFSDNIHLQIQLAIQSLYKGINSISFKNNHHLKPQKEQKCLTHEGSCSPLSVVLAQSFKVEHSVLPPFPTAKGTRNDICLPASPQQEIFMCFFC